MNFSLKGLKPFAIGATVALTMAFAPSAASAQTTPTGGVVTAVSCGACGAGGGGGGGIDPCSSLICRG